MTRELPWCSIDIDTTAGKIVLLERWQYIWLVESRSTLRWTLAEKQVFHQGVDREVWAAWSNRAFLQVAGSSEFAKRYSGRMIPVFMDVRWVLAKPHWTVTVTKIEKGKISHSNTNWWDRKITLDSNDAAVRTRLIGPSKDVVNQVPVAHEFGHAIGNVSAFARGDEFVISTPFSRS